MLSTVPRAWRLPRTKRAARWATRCIMLPPSSLAGRRSRSHPAGQFRQGLVALQRCQGDLRLECRCVVAPRPACHALAPVGGRSRSPGMKQGYHLDRCPILRGHLCPRQGDGLGKAEMALFGKFASSASRLSGPRWLSKMVEFDH